VLDHSSNKMCLIRCGDLRLVLPASDIASVELAEDIQPVLQQKSATGYVEGMLALTQGQWRVALLDTELKFKQYLSQAHRYVACLSNTEFGAYGLMCDDAKSIALPDQHREPLPTIMQTQQQVFNQLIKYENRIALITDARRLSQYCAITIGPNRAIAAA